MPVIIFLIIRKINIFFRGGADPENQCEYTYQGPLCSKCIAGFSKLDNLCLECKNMALDVFAIILAIIFYLSFLLILIM